MIEDNGEGCSEESLEKMFEPFFTTKKAQNGTGLGMPSIKSIVEQYGGNIQVEGKTKPEYDETGLIIKISFPIHAES